MASAGDRLVDRARREPVRSPSFGLGGLRDHSRCEKRVDESCLAAGELEHMLGDGGSQQLHGDPGGLDELE